LLLHFTLNQDSLSKYRRAHSLRLRVAIAYASVADSAMLYMLAFRAAHLSEADSRSLIRSPQLHGRLLDRYAAVIGHQERLFVRSFERDGNSGIELYGYRNAFDSKPDGRALLLLVRRCGGAIQRYLDHDMHHQRYTVAIGLILAKCQETPTYHVLRHASGLQFFSIPKWAL
jgi:hypothetical protein